MAESYPNEWKTLGKGEIAHYEQFLLFPQCFQKACFLGASKGVILWGWIDVHSWQYVPFIFLSKDQILHVCDMKALAKLCGLHYGSNRRKGREHHWKGRKMLVSNFSFFPQCFQKPYFS